MSEDLSNQVLSSSKGPIFVMGRQHSGNTMLTVMLGMMPGIYAHHGESVFFDSLGRMSDSNGETMERRIADLVAASADPMLSGELVRTKLQALSYDRRASGPAAAVSLLDTIMGSLAQDASGSRWAQKATSGIFYVEEILRYMPNAKLLYCIRNPFDIAYSLKRRGVRSFGRGLWAWNKGGRLAMDFQDNRSSNFQIVRYEDILLNSEIAISRICDFVDEPYFEGMLQPVHINPAEDQYSIVHHKRGLDHSRANRWRSGLTEREAALVAHLVDSSVFQHFYPEMRADLDRGGEARSLDIAMDKVNAGLDIASSVLGNFARDPFLALDLVRKRVG